MCPGGEDFSCGDGYQDRLCSICEDGYLYTLNKCHKCPGGGGGVADYLFTIGAEVVSNGLWFVLNTQVATYAPWYPRTTISQPSVHTMIQVADAFDSVDLALLFMQIVAICQMFNVPWPEALVQLMNIFSIANFDVRFCSLWHDLSKHLTFFLPTEGRFCFSELHHKLHSSLFLHRPDVLTSHCCGVLLVTICTALRSLSPFEEEGAPKIGKLCGDTKEGLARVGWVL